MLMLTRRVGETIRIGDDVTVVVLGAKGNQIRLGVEAPDEIEVHREEIFNRIAGKKGIANPGGVNKTQKPRKGTVAKLVEDKGFGFIYTPGVEKPIFFHSSEALNEDFSAFCEGDDVEFTVRQGGRGPLATKVKRVSA